MSRITDVEVSFHRSITLCVCLASMILAYTEGTWFPAGVTPVVACFAYFAADRRWLTLPVAGANVLGAIATIVVALEFYHGTVYEKLLSGAHMLIYLTWIVLLMRKGYRQYWWLCALSVLQLAVTSVMTQRPEFGASLIGMLFVLIWTLSLFTLHRSQRYHSASSGSLKDSLSIDDSDPIGNPLIRVQHGVQSDVDERWTGWGFRFIVVWTSFGSLIVAVVAFTVFPRYFVEGMSLAPFDEDSSGIRTRSGFNENIQLGQTGTVEPSEDRVFQFNIRELSTDQTVSAEEFETRLKLDEIRFRGTALAMYSGGEWERSPTSRRERWENISRQLDSQAGQSADYVIRITQDPPVGSYAFAVKPMLNAVTREGAGNIRVSSYTGALVFERRRNTPTKTDPVVYDIYCTATPAEVNASSHWWLPDLGHILEDLPANLAWLRTQEELVRQRALTPDIPDQLPRLAELASRLRLDEKGIPLPPDECIQKFESFLSAGGGYKYSLDQQVTDRSIDPVEDFLFNHKTGHCEYFASACVLMLQAEEIPARIVNGYKGYETNSLTGDYEVRQKHAHAWVEAWNGQKWVTVDPTPAAAREETVASAGSFGLFVDLKVAFNDGWLRFVQKMNLDRQKDLVQPILEAFQQFADTMNEQGVWAALKMFFREYILSPQKWFSWQGGVVTFIILWTTVLVVRRAPWLIVVAWIRRFRERFDSHQRAARNVIRFYESFISVCERHGLRFSENQTARENAFEAARHFAPYLASPDLQRIPMRIAIAFNQVRFGSVPLESQQADAIRDDLHQFLNQINKANHKGRVPSKVAG